MWNAFELRPPIGASSIHIGFDWPVAVLLTQPFPPVAMRLGPVLAGPVHSCVGAARRFAAVCCARGWRGGAGGRHTAGGTNQHTGEGGGLPPAGLTRWLTRVNPVGGPPRVNP